MQRDIERLAARSQRRQPLWRDKVRRGRRRRACARAAVRHARSRRAVSRPRAAGEREAPADRRRSGSPRRFPAARRYIRAPPRAPSSARPLALAAPHRLAAKAEAAIDRADRQQLQQHAVGVAMHEARHGAVRVVADGIGEFHLSRHQFARVGQELPRDGVGASAGSISAAISRRHRDAVARRDRAQRVGGAPAGRRARGRPRSIAFSRSCRSPASAHTAHGIAAARRRRTGSSSSAPSGPNRWNRNLAAHETETPHPRAGRRLERRDLHQRPAGLGDDEGLRPSRPDRQGATTVSWLRGC